MERSLTELLALLGWSIKDLEEISHVSDNSIRREMAGNATKLVTRQKIVAAISQGLQEPLTIEDVAWVTLTPAGGSQATADIPDEKRVVPELPISVADLSSLLGWNVKVLATRAGIAEYSVRQEIKGASVRVRTRQKIVDAFSQVLQSPLTIENIAWVNPTPAQDPRGSEKRVRSRPIEENPRERKAVPRVPISIPDLCTFLGWTKSQFIKLSGYSRETIYNELRGKSMSQVCREHVLKVFQQYVTGLETVNDIAWVNPQPRLHIGRPNRGERQGVVLRITPEAMKHIDSVLPPKGTYQGYFDDLVEKYKDIELESHPRDGASGYRRIASFKFAKEELKSIRNRSPMGVQAFFDEILKREMEEASQPCDA